MNYMKQIADFSLTSYSFDPIDSRMYILAGLSESVLIIDPCVSEEALQQVEAGSASQVLLLLTHEHYDHISGVNWWKERSSSKIICSDVCGKRIEDARLNASEHFDLLFLFADQAVRQQIKSVDSYTCCADETFKDSLHFTWGGHRVHITATPGHSPGSSCILLDNRYCFTGDSLIYNRVAVTRLPGGNKEEYEKKAAMYLKSLDIDTYIFPGHGRCFRMKDVNLDGSAV